jgi:adenosylhomocysteine nucleosidase
LKVLGIIAALRSEARILTRSIVFATDLVHLPGGALVKVSGMGAVRAKAAAELLIAEGAVALLSWGIGGALHPKISPGHLILPEKVVIPGKPYLFTDKKWHERLFTCLDNHLCVHTKPLGQSSSVLSKTAEKIQFSQLNEAVAVDMESGSVAQAAKEANLPCMVIRAIADPLEQDIPVSVLEVIDERGRLRPWDLLGRLARKPLDLLPLQRVRRNFAAARATLITVARLVGEDFLAF